MKKRVKDPAGIPLGFKFAAVNAGIKHTKRDLALIYSVVPAQAAGVFTKNKVQAAPVKICRSNLKNGTAQAIIANSGNANCCNGAAGIRDAEKVCRKLAGSLDVKAQDILPASTGVIGRPLPVEKILNALDELKAGLDFVNARSAAEAIMTTDTFPKLASARIKIGKKTITVSGMVKGAGMIAPDMATMLCFITTDANISRSLLKQALKSAAAGSFNMISVDAQMSTNDSVLVLANGLAGNPLIKTADANFRKFAAALETVCRTLAMMMVEDAEGGSKVIRVEVRGAATDREAKNVARKIADSPLVKTMVAGANPNWGRIPACVGAGLISSSPEKMRIFLQGKCVYQNEQPQKVKRELLIRLMKKDRVDIAVELKGGRSAYTMWTSDLTAAYVKINTEYN